MNNVSGSTLKLLHSRERVEEWRDVVRTLQAREVSYNKKRRLPITADPDPWRPIMVQWMYSVVDIFDLVPHVVSTAVWYLDQSAGLVRSAQDYQLVGLTSLQMAIKVHETKLFPLEQLVKIGNSGFTSTDVVEMEKRILNVLAWQLHPPTTECFVYTFGELLEESKDEVVATALACSRQALLGQMPFTASVTAYASLLVAMERSPQVSMDEKHAFASRMLKMAGLSAYTPGLSQAFDRLSPKDLMPVATPQKPVVVHKTEEEKTREVPSMQELIFSAEDGVSFEVTWCTREYQKETEIQLSASFSPRNVAME